MLTPEECEKLRQAFFKLEEALGKQCTCAENDDCERCQLVMEARNLYRKVIGAV